VDDIVECLDFVPGDDIVTRVSDPWTSVQHAQCESAVAGCSSNSGAAHDAA
jgi:hypothetical protein